MAVSTFSGGMCFSADEAVGQSHLPAPPEAVLDVAKREGGSGRWSVAQPASQGGRKPQGLTGLSSLREAASLGPGILLLTVPLPPAPDRITENTAIKHSSGPTALSPGPRHRCFYGSQHTSTAKYGKLKRKIKTEGAESCQISELAREPPKGSEVVVKENVGEENEM